MLLGRFYASQPLGQLPLKVSQQLSALALAVKPWRFSFTLLPRRSGASRVLKWWRCSGPIGSRSKRNKACVRH
jgi:hypothetical protein